MSYEVTRAAVEIQKVEPAPVDIELELYAVDRQRKRFSWLSLATIAVSFVHMFSALALFSKAHWLDQAAAVAMTGLVDFATWAIANYIDYAKRRRLSRSGWVRTLFYAALTIGCGLNFAYLYANRPGPEVLPWLVSLIICVAFAFFIPACIGVASLIRGELEDDRVNLETEEKQRTASAPASPAITVLESTQNSALQQPNETITQPVLPPLQERHNFKSPILTTDPVAIVTALRNAGITRFQYARELGDLCGWSSPSSSAKAMATLREAGVLRDVEGGYEVVYREGEQQS